MKDPASLTGSQLMSTAGGPSGDQVQGGGQGQAPIPTAALPSLDMGDLSRHRMTLMQLQNYAAQLNRHQPIPTTTGSAPSFLPGGSSPQQQWQQQQGENNVLPGRSAMGAADMSAGPPGSGGSMIDMFDRARQMHQARLMGSLPTLTGGTSWPHPGGCPKRGTEGPVI